MALKPLLTLSERAVITDEKLLLTRLFGNYILTDGGQSLIQKLISLPMTYQKHINDPAMMALVVKEDLMTLIRYYFDDADVTTEVKLDPDTQFATILLFAEGVNSETGVSVKLGNLVNIDPSGIGRIININNYGDGLRMMENL